MFLYSLTRPGARGGPACRRARPGGCTLCVVPSPTAGPRVRSGEQNTAGRPAPQRLGAAGRVVPPPCMARPLLCSQRARRWAAENPHVAGQALTPGPGSLSGVCCSSSPCFSVNLVTRGAVCFQLCGEPGLRSSLVNDSGSWPQTWVQILPPPCSDCASLGSRRVFLRKGGRTPTHLPAHMKVQ